MNRQSRFDAGCQMLGAGALGWPREMVWEGRWEGGSGLGTHVHPWRVHVDVWQNQYSIVKLNKKKEKQQKKRKYILSNRLKVVLYISLGMFRGLNLNEFRYYLVKGLLLKQIEMRMNWQYILGKYGKEDMTYDGKPNYAELLCSLFCFALRALS